MNAIEPERGWKRLAMEAMRYLSAEQIAEATKAAGAETYICAAPPLQGESSPPSDEPFAWAIIGASGYISDIWSRPNHYGVGTEQAARERAAWCNENWPSEQGPFEAIALYRQPTAAPIPEERRETRDDAPSERLRAIIGEYHAASDAVKAEQNAAGGLGRLQSNDRCASWPRYERANAAFWELIEEFRAPISEEPR